MTNTISPWTIFSVEQLVPFCLLEQVLANYDHHNYWDWPELYKHNLTNFKVSTSLLASIQSRVNLPVRCSSYVNATGSSNAREYDVRAKPRCESINWCPGRQGHCSNALSCLPVLPRDERMANPPTSYKPCSGTWELYHRGRCTFWDSMVHPTHPSMHPLIVRPRGRVVCSHSLPFVERPKHLGTVDVEDSLN